MKLLNYFLLLLFAVAISNLSFSQYILNGSAKPISCNCYTLTTEVNNDSGSVWNGNKIDLNQSFDFHFNVFLGCLDSTGADGIVFILQPLSTTLGGAGGGMGFTGISPSVGIALDTWQNFEFNDPWFDHISIQLNGDVIHGHDLAGPIPASATSFNIEDCKWHVLRITWDASSKTLTTYFDGQFRLQAQYDLVGNVFHNDPLVYWGFGASTGGSFNVQQFCTSLNPLFTTNLADSATCIGNKVTFVDQSESFSVIKDYYWDFDDGNTSTLQNPPDHLYILPGRYEVKHVITGQDGCVSDTTQKTIVIGSNPVADFNLNDTCSFNMLGIVNESTDSVGRIDRWTWQIDNAEIFNDASPVISNLDPGAHELSLVETSEYGCTSNTFVKTFEMKPTPVVSISANDGCWHQPLQFFGQQDDNATHIVQWHWQFGDNSVGVGSDPTHAYNDGGSKTVYLNAIADNGCVSHDTSRQIYIESILADAGRDTSVQSHIPFHLDGSASGNYNGLPTATWSPSIGLGSINGFDPTTTLIGDQRYQLKLTTDDGCVAFDSVKIRVFNTPGVLVPTAFTPNNDGLNDLLRPRYNGIKNLDYFSVYNRWGQLVFKTSDMNAGWDGRINGTIQNSGTFVWIINARGFDGKRYQLKGTSTIVN